MLEENTPGMKRRLSGDYDDPDESQQDLNAAYKEFMKKRAKMQAVNNKNIRFLVFIFHISIPCSGRIMELPPQLTRK